MNYLNELMLVSLLVIVSRHNVRSNVLIVFIHQFLWPLPLVIALRPTFVIVLNQKFLCGLCAEGADFPRPRYAQAAKLWVAVCV